MIGREKITGLLNQVEKELKDLEIAYEQYFLGIEKRSPEQQRSKFTVRMRKLVTLHIPQTALRYRVNGIASRFNSYCGYWDRIQRLIDEGKYERHTSRIQRRAGESTSMAEAPGNEKPTPWTTFTSSLSRLTKAARCAPRTGNRLPASWPSRPRRSSSALATSKSISSS